MRYASDRSIKEGSSPCKLLIIDDKQVLAKLSVRISPPPAKCPVSS